MKRGIIGIAEKVPETRPISCASGTQEISKYYRVYLYVTENMVVTK